MTVSYTLAGEVEYIYRVSYIGLGADGCAYITMDNGGECKVPVADIQEVWS